MHLVESKFNLPCDYICVLAKLHDICPLSISATTSSSLTQVSLLTSPFSSYITTTGYPNPSRPSTASSCQGSHNSLQHLSQAMSVVDVTGLVKIYGLLTITESLIVYTAIQVSLIEFIHNVYCSKSKTLGEFSEVHPKGGVDSIKRNREEMETRTQMVLAGLLTQEKKHVFIGK